VRQGFRLDPGSQASIKPTEHVPLPSAQIQAAPQGVESPHSNVRQRIKHLRVLGDRLLQLAKAFAKYCKRKSSVGACLAGVFLGDGLQALSR